MSDGQSPDPYVRAFLRQAVAILATERGFNDATNAKLSKIAIQLGLAPETFQSAIEKLKRLDGSVALNRYENSFVQLLSREFEKMQGDVLTIAAEKKLVEIAGHKYQIDPLRAQQLIQKAAEQFHVGTVSHSDAQQFALHLIQDAIGRNIRAQPTVLDRLYHVCNKWGLDQAGVDRHLSKLLIQNRRQRRQSVIRWAGGCGAIVVVAVLVGLAAWHFDWSNSQTAQRSPGGANDTVVAPTGNQFPQWWKLSLANSATRLASRSKSAAAMIERLSQQETEAQVSAYRLLIDGILDSSSADHLGEQFLIGLYLADPSESNADLVRKQLEDALRVTRRDDVASFRQLRRAITANRLIGRSLSAEQTELQPGRLSAMQVIVNHFFGTYPSPCSLEQYLAQTESLLWQEHWRHAVRFSHSQPEAVAAMMGQLELYGSSDRNSGFNEMRMIVLQRILERHPILWNTIRDSISVAIRESETATLNKWLADLAALGDFRMAEFLSRQLETRTANQSTGGLTAETGNQNNNLAADRPIAIRTRLDHRQREFRKLLIQFGIDKQVVPPDRLPADQIPNLIHQTSLINNLLLAWLELDGSDRSHLISSRLLQLSERAGSLGIEAMPPAAEATPFQRREFQQALQKLLSTDNRQVNTRIVAIEKLAGLARNFDELEYDHASQLAASLLSATDPQEVLAIERALPQFAHWFQLKLAAADYLTEQAVSAENAAQILRGLGVGDLPAQEPDWKARFQDRVLEHCRLAIRESPPRVALQTAWNSLQTMYRQRIGERCEIMNLAGNHQAGATSEFWIDAIDAWMLRQAKIRRPHFQRRLTLAANQPSEIHRLAICNRLFADLLQCEHDLEPTAQVALQPRDGWRSTPGEHLLSGELALYHTLKKMIEQRDSDE